MLTKTSKHYGYLKLVVGACREWTAGVAAATVSKQRVCSKATLNISMLSQNPQLSAVLFFDLLPVIDSLAYCCTPTERLSSNLFF